jgi:carbonic anhydrase
MRLFEAILEANSRAVAGDTTASIRQSEYAAELPIAALTCIDARLNPLVPDVLGVAEEHFIWLRNAGNIITSPTSSTMRSLALACAVKGAKEIAVIGHTDCQVCKTTTMQLLEKFKTLGVERHVLPDNINEYFGLFSSERQNVIKACDTIRQSPLIGPKIPVHGLLLDIQTGQLEWLVNGYSWATMSNQWNDALKSAGETLDKFKSLTDFKIGGMSFSETKIGDTVAKAEDWLSKGLEKLELKPSESTEGEQKHLSATSIAEQIVDVAQKHWPKQPQSPARPAGKPAVPPPLRVRAVPPRIKK